MKLKAFSAAQKITGYSSVNDSLRLKAVLRIFREWSSEYYIFALL